MLRSIFAVVVALLFCTGTAWAGPISIGSGWLALDWGIGSPAPASGNPYTFTTPPEGATLKVTDAYLAGDQFEVYRDAISLGQTPWVSTGGDWTDDPDVAYSNPVWSSGSWSLPGGEAISINIYTITNPYDYGTGYLRVDAVPEPGTVLLLAAGLLALATIRRGRVS